MSNPSDSSAKCPVASSSKAQTKGIGKSQEQRGTDRDSKPTESPSDTRKGRAPTRRSGSGQTEKQTEGQESNATRTSDRKGAPERQANGNPQRRKQKDCERDEPLKTLESKTEDQRTTEEKKRKASKPVTSKSDSVGAAHAQGSDAPKSAKSGRPTQSKPKVEKRDQSASIASDINPNSLTQNDLSDTDSVTEDEPPELPSTSQERRKPKLTKTHNSKNTESTEEDTGAHQSRNIELEKVLLATNEKLKIKKLERSKASSCVNEVTDKVISHLKQNVTWCKDIEGLTTGSYYENVKICKPDEFDVMLTIPLERVDIQVFGDNGAFYSIALKRHSDKHPLHKFLNEDKTIKASEMLNEFRDGVKEALESMKHKKYSIDVQRKKQKCPAVTLVVTENGNAISIDFVLALKVCSSWPSNTNDGFKIEKWLGTKEKRNLKRKPYYLVPKYEGKGNVEHGGVVAKDVWRISFSHIEKAILEKHGHSKTCCEAHGKKCCRKECLKLLKYLLSQLEEQHPDKMSKFCSYHAKTALLHACATKVEDSEWAFGLLANCFQQLLDAFVAYLSKQDLRNFFVPSQNLLHPDNLPKSNCEFLAKQIEIQRNNNFPIFQ